MSTMKNSSQDKDVFGAYHASHGDAFRIHAISQLEVLT